MLINMVNNLVNKWRQNSLQRPGFAQHMAVAGSNSDCICVSSWRSCYLQERLAEISAERAVKKLAAHQAAEQRLKEAAMPPRMQLAAQVEYACCHMTLLMHCTVTFAACSMTWSITHIALDYVVCGQVML